jgi:chromosome segregation ATPase
MGELKPRSYRIDDETAEKIKAICTEMGEGQQVAFSRMIEAYEMQGKKISLGDDKEQVEQFEAYSSILARMFMDTVEAKHNMKETVRTEYATMLTSKDEIIQDLQKKNLAMADEVESANKRASELQKENTSLYDEINRLESKMEGTERDFRAKMADKDTLNQTLNESCAELREKNANMKETVKKAEDALKKIQEQEQAHKEEIAALELENRRQLRELEQKLKKAQTENERNSFETEKKLLEMQQQCADKVEQLRNDAQSRVDAYQQKYIELLERIGNGE